MNLLTQAKPITSLKDRRKKAARNQDYVVACRTRHFRPIDVADVVHRTVDDSKIGPRSVLEVTACIVSRLGSG